MIESQWFSDLYWHIVVYWWRAFNFYHDYTTKEGMDFARSYVFHHERWQIYFLVSAVLIAPFSFYWQYSKGRELKLFQIRESRRFKQAEKEKLARDKASEESRKARKLEHEERLRQEREAEQVAQKNLQSKINEVKGKNPWESGFL